MSVVRACMASAAVAAAVALAGCETDGTSRAARALKPLSHEMVTVLERKNMPTQSPVLVRLFKEESELEIWKQDASGRFALLKTYPICRWSGELGPKIKEGDRQAPEGFYTITPAQMNPNSQYFLSFNIGYPNDFDRAYGRTGSQLMVHGDCSSRGCYAMTDEQISEIYALARESFFGGQRSFQVQAYPFRMTPLNLAKHRNNPNMPFWKMLKEGYDHFEVTRLEPKVDVCEKRYVFDAEPPGEASPAGPMSVLHGTAGTPSLNFNPGGRCPAYQVPHEIAAEVAAKSKRDEIETAELIRKGAPVAPIRTGVDGGMHPVFLAVVKPHEVRDVDGFVRMVVDAKAPGTVPPTVNPPREPEPPTGTVAASTPGPRAPAPSRDGAAPAASSAAPGRASGGVLSSAPKPPPTQQHSQVAAARPPTEPESGSMFTRLFSSDAGRPPSGTTDQPGTGLGSVTSSVSRLFGASGDKKPPSAPQPAAVPLPPPKPAAPARTAAGPTHLGTAPPPRPNPPPKPAEGPSAELGPPAAAASGTGLLPGAQPVVPVGSFDSRWGAVR